MKLHFRVQFFCFSGAWLRAVFGRDFVKEKKLTARERAFCLLYLTMGDAVKAVKASGYKRGFERRAQVLMTRDDIREEILRLCELKKATSREFARGGFERLAFGSIADAVSLLYLEKPTKQELDNMDLFCVSEIKRPKDGSMEIKFFDRLKALQSLFEKEDTDKSEASNSSVFEAIAMGAAALGEKGKKDGD